MRRPTCARRSGATRRACSDEAPIVALAALLAGGTAAALPFKAQRARLAILDLALDDAASIVEGDDSPEVALERGRLGLYLGDCDAAQRALERPDLHDDDELAALDGRGQGMRARDGGHHRAPRRGARRSWCASRTTRTARSSR
jgi:hypothetical protein